MSDNDLTRRRAPTRREYVKYGGVAAGGGLLAGCTGGSGSGPSSGSGDNETVSGSSDDGSYTVEMFPVGEVELAEVPETWTALTTDGWSDMAVALGQAEGCRTPNVRLALYHDALDVEVNTDWPAFWEETGGSWAIPKETFYEVDADLHLIDPNRLKNSDDDWDDDDIEETESRVGPFFCCYNRRTTTDWQRDLDYREKAPSMLEAFEKLGEVFQEQDRAEALLEVHDELQAALDDRMDGVEPASIGLINGGSQPEKGTFYPLDLSDPGYEMKTYRDLGVEDAFADFHDGEYGGELDYEGLLEYDPEVLVVHWGIINTEDSRFDPEAFHEQYVAPMEDHGVGSELTAVQEGSVYPGAYGEQGPIANLFQTELTGQQLYPEQFGEFDPQAYPDLSEENRLFDRQRVADIIDGDI